MLDNIKRNSNGSYSPREDYGVNKIKAGCSNVYWNEEVLKIYHSFIPESYRITEEIFKTLRDIDFDNFIKLKDYYMDRKMIAYTAEYIEHKNSLNLLDMDDELVKYNFMKIEKLILLFTKLAIAIDDVNYRNFLCSGNDLIVVDPDMYRFIYNDEKGRNLTIDELLAYNYKKLLDGFFDLFVKSYYKVARYYSIGSEEFNRMMVEVFHYDRYDKAPVYRACKRLEDLKINNYKKS